MADNRKPTNIRMPDRAYEQIDELIEWGLGSTKAAVIVLAIDRLYQQEVARRKEQSGKSENSQDCE